MTELKCLVPKRSRQNPTKKISKPARDTQPFTISMPVIDLVDDPETPLYAWRYHDEKGKQFNTVQFTLMAYCTRDFVSIWTMREGGESRFRHLLAGGGRAERVEALDPTTGK